MSNVQLYTTHYACFREVMVMENTNPFTGTCGTISWQLLEINMRLIIMWSVPFNFNIRDSYYAIGLTHNKVCIGDNFYKILSGRSNFCIFKQFA